MNKFFDALTRGHKSRAVIRHLETMDDRMLRDIGLDRSQINDLFGGRKRR